jgi:hypothetical protein
MTRSLLAFFLDRADYFIKEGPPGAHPMLPSGATGIVIAAFAVIYLKLFLTAIG